MAKGILNLMLFGSGISLLVTEFNWKVGLAAALLFLFVKDDE